jgi:hypothetical protein
MMTLEAEEGNYKIYSEKEDHCPYGSAWLISAVGVAGIITFILLSFFFAITDHPLKIWGLIGVIVSIITAVIPFHLL